VLKLKVEKVTVIRVTKAPFLAATRIFSIYTDFQIFLIALSFFLWSPVAPELGTDPRLGLARTAP
jgi:hypothetical protein